MDRERSQKQLSAVFAHPSQQVWMAKILTVFWSLFRCFQANVADAARGVRGNGDVVAGREPSHIQRRLDHAVCPEKAVLPGGAGKRGVEDGVAELTFQVVEQD